MEHDLFVQNSSTKDCNNSRSLQVFQYVDNCGSKLLDAYVKREVLKDFYRYFFTMNDSTIKPWGKRELPTIQVQDLNLTERYSRSIDTLARLWSSNAQS